MAIALVAIVSIGLRIACSQTNGAQFATIGHEPEFVCGNAAIDPAASAALRILCQKAPNTQLPFSATTPMVIIGFVGGFASPNDLHHPEPLFALYLRQHYGSALHAKVFSNHGAKDAEIYLLQLLDANHDGVLSNEERKKARVVIFGHSWGASETASFARKLGRLKIPVLLTVQLDIIAKPGQKPEMIPPNVENAINFYQGKGPLHGRPKIVALDPAATTILGNIHMTYSRSAVNCDNYNWFVRTFNKPHHEIENDPNVWDKVASLIDTEVSLEHPVNETLSAPAAHPDSELPDSEPTEGMQKHRANR